ncbi:MAG TPA: methionyl-tRNA formyltransferase [Longimicrobiales bacterium]
MRILFWGTPAFSLPALRAVLGEGHEVVGVVTQPDRPAGRGHALTPPPVKKLAQEEALLVLQPERARGPDFVARIKELEPDLSVVVAFGQILRREVIDVPRLGTINVHASLLPELRGAAPIQWSIIRGHEQTGVTIMRIVEALDAGPMIYRVTEPIGPEETARDLAVRVAELGAEALVEALALLEAEAAHEEPQDDARATFAPRFTRDDAHIDFGLSAVEVDRWIRGLDDVPGAWAQLGEEDVKLFRPRPHPDRAHDAAPGMVLAAEAEDATTGILVACGTGAVCIREVKPAGKRRMTAADWVRGRGIAVGDRLL